MGVISRTNGLPDTKLVRNERGIWEIRWTERDGAAGRSRSRSHSTRTTDREEAEQVRRTWIIASAQVVAGAQAEAGTVAELVTEYLRAKGYGEGSSQDFNLRPIVAALGGRIVSELSTRTLADYRDGRLTGKITGNRVSWVKTGEGARGVKSGTVRRELSALSAALEWGRRAGMVNRDFMLEVDLPPEGQAKARWLDDAEEEAVWEEAVRIFTEPGKPFRERRVGLFVCLALETAARKEAILELTWDRVDTRAWLIDYRDPQKAVSNKRRVPVPVSDRLKPILARAQMDVLAGRGGGTKWVLGHSGNVREAFEAMRGRLLADGLLPGGSFTIHDMRRTWASLRVQWGVPLEQVAAVLGDSLEIVQKHYAHLAPGFLTAAVNARGPVRSARAGAAA